METKLLQEISEKLDRVIAFLEGDRHSRPENPAKHSRASEVPQPASKWPRASEMVIHFSKNRGRTLGSLTHGQLTWYAKDWSLRRNCEHSEDGYWPNDRDLQDAARYLWHDTNGTLEAYDSRPHAPEVREPANPAPRDEKPDTDVPF